MFHSCESHTHRAHRNQEQHHDGPWPCPRVDNASCFQTCLCFSNTPGCLWPPACHLPFFLCHKEELLLSLISKRGSPAVAGATSATRAVSPQRAQTKASLCTTMRLGSWHSDMWACRAANGYFSCYFKPRVYNQNMSLPKTAACPMAFTQVPLLLCQPSPSCLVGLK